MANPVLSAPQFQTEEGAFAYVESRLWPQGPVCPHCGNMDGARIRKMEGKTTRLGLYKCNECRKPFTVRMRTIFESSHLPLHLWLQIIHLMCASKKGIATRQIQRMLVCSMKTAWFLTHRIREAMRDGSLAPMGGAGGIVEVDETTFGRTLESPKKIPRGRSSFRNVVLTLVERGGSARSFHIDSTTIATIKPIIAADIDRESSLMTDEARWCPEIGRDFVNHDTITHSHDEYVRSEGEKKISTNTVEGYYGVFKRGMQGVYQHCGERLLHRYLSEFDFRYSNRVALGINDSARAERALQGVKGKRLTYQTIGQ
jgi:transposase-like protein